MGVNFYTDNKGQKSAITNNYAWVGNGRNDGQIYVPSAGGFVINDNRFTDKESTLKIIKEEQLEVIIAIETPIEKEFSFERLYAYREFTTIHNDEKAEMEVTYIADVKKYIAVELASIKKAQANMISLAPDDIQAQMIENDINNLLKESEVI